MLTSLSNSIRTHPLWNRLLHWRRRYLTQRVQRMLGVGILLAILLFFALALYSGWTQVQPHLLDMNLLRVGTGVALTFCALVIGAFAWYFSQRGVGILTSWQRGIAIHFAANGTKYLPGYAWQYISKGYLGVSEEVSTQRITLAILTEVVLLLSGGLLSASIVGLITPLELPLPWQAAWAIPRTLLWLVAGSMLALASGWSIFVVRSQPITRPSRRFLWLVSAWLAGVIGWCIYATACWYFITALVPVPASNIGLCLVALVLSGIVSMAVLIVPGGLGVREATLAILLSGLIPLSLGVVVSILMRLSLVISELAGMLLLLALVNHWPEQLKRIYPRWGQYHKRTE